MEKLFEFKTKCISQYVTEMKNYLTNWELKQEYLVNLRKEFALDHDLLLHHLQKAKEAANAANPSSAAGGRLVVRVWSCCMGSDIAPCGRSSLPTRHQARHCGPWHRD